MRLRVASLLFDPPEPQIMGKTQGIATFLPFRAPPSSFIYLFLFSDLLSSSLLLSDSPSAFPSLHIAGSLTSKLPSISYTTHPRLTQPSFSISSAEAAGNFQVGTN